MRVGESGRREESEIKSCMGIGVKEVEGDLGFQASCSDDVNGDKGIM